jgi:glutathione S-transferase
MVLKIYGGEARAARTGWLVRELDQDIEIDSSFAPNPGKGMKDEAKSRELEKLNPNVRIPVLVDGDFVLTETCAIHSK